MQGFAGLSICGYINRYEIPPPGPLFHCPGGSPITRSFFTEKLNRSLIWSGLSPKTYKEHSFRIGAATMAWMMVVSVEELQRMGRWWSRTIKK